MWSQPIRYSSNGTGFECIIRAGTQDSSFEEVANVSTTHHVSTTTWHHPTEPIAACSWAGEDCSDTRCCNERSCSWDFQTCEPLTCFRRDANFSQCRDKCPEGWDCEPLGQSLPRKALPPALAGEASQSSFSLFCFAVVTPSSANEISDEQALAVFQEKEGLGVFACDAHLVLEGAPRKVLGQSVKSHIDAYLEQWEEVRKDGTYLKHDFVVKTHPDAVFFPDRLKIRLQRLAGPAGAKVYFENVNYKYKFLSPLEVLSVEAATLFLQHGWECAGHLGHEGSEDYYLKTCLDALGADHQVDFKLLQDRYADPSVINCNDLGAVAFHWYKLVPQWEKCHKDAVLASTQHV